MEAVLEQEDEQEITTTSFVKVTIHEHLSQNFFCEKEKVSISSLG